VLNEGGKEGKARGRDSSSSSSIRSISSSISSSSSSSSSSSRPPPARPIRKGGGGEGGRKTLGGRAITALLHQHEGDLEGLLNVIETHVAVFEKQNCAMAFNR